LAQQALDLGLVRGGHHDVIDQAARVTAAALLELVDVAGALAHHLGGTGHPETLLGTAVGLHLRHGPISFWSSRPHRGAAVCAWLDARPREDAWVTSPIRTSAPQPRRPCAAGPLPSP